MWTKEELLKHYHEDKAELGAGAENALFLAGLFDTIGNASNMADPILETYRGLYRIMDEVSAYPYESADTQILLVSDKGITQSAGLVTAWADQSAAGNDMTTATALTAAADSFGLGVCPKTGALTSYPGGREHGRRQSGKPPGA